MLPRPPRPTLFPYTTLFRSGSKVAMLFREEPGQQVQDDLRHLKQVLETGEIVVSDATKERGRSEEHTSELQSQFHLVCRLLLEKKNASANFDRNLTHLPTSQ